MIISFIKYVFVLFVIHSNIPAFKWLIDAFLDILWVALSISWFNLWPAIHFSPFSTAELCYAACVPEFVICLRQQQQKEITTYFFFYCHFNFVSVTEMYGKSLQLYHLMPCPFFRQRNSNSRIVTMKIYESTIHLTHVFFPSSSVGCFFRLPKYHFV